MGDLKNKCFEKSSYKKYNNRVFGNLKLVEYGIHIYLYENMQFCVFRTFSSALIGHGVQNDHVVRP